MGCVWFSMTIIEGSFISLAFKIGFVTRVILFIGSFDSPQLWLVHSWTFFKTTFFIQWHICFSIIVICFTCWIAQGHQIVKNAEEERYSDIWKDEIIPLGDAPTDKGGRLPQSSSNLYVPCIPGSEIQKHHQSYLRIRLSRKWNDWMCTTSTSHFPFRGTVTVRKCDVPRPIYNGPGLYKTRSGICSSESIFTNICLFWSPLSPLLHNSFYKKIPHPLLYSFRFFISWN